MSIVKTDFTREQIDLIKQTVAAGTSDLELQLFLEACKSSGLSPFQKQIYAVMRKSRSGKDAQGAWIETQRMVIQTGIDGYRAIAARTGAHAGTTDAEFGPLVNKYPEWARVTVKRVVQGVVAEFSATARWSEYVQTKAEYLNGKATGKQAVSDMWARMPFTMLAKCAESLALRKGFPAELSGVYTDEEMGQADSSVIQVETIELPALSARVGTLTADQASRLHAKLGAMGFKADMHKEYASEVLKRPIESFEDVTALESKRLVEQAEIDRSTVAAQDAAAVFEAA